MRERYASLLSLTAAGALSALLYLVNFDLARVLPWREIVETSGGGLAAYPVLSAALFILYGLASLHVFRTRSGPRHLAVILGFAVLFRVSLLAAPLVLSSDVNRYVWDGRVQAAGINPYLYPPAADELASLRDDRIFPAINRPTAPTAYPPGAQMLFALIQLAVPDSLAGMKAVMILFDLATIGLLLLLLARTGVAPERVLVYAWSPLVIVEFAGSGHAEALMLPFLLLALLGRMDGKPLLAGGALGAATLIKLYPAALFPVLYRRGEGRFPLAFAATVVAGYLVYLPGAGGGVIGFLPDYLGEAEDFNIGLRSLLTSALGPLGAAARPISMLLVSALLLAVAVVLAGQAQGDVLWRGYLMVSAYFVLLPTSLHPWYLTWIVPFLCWYPSWGWLYLAGAVSLSYLKYTQDTHPSWVWAAQFVPLYGLLLVEAVRHRRQAPWSGVAAGALAEPRR